MNQKTPNILLLTILYVFASLGSVVITPALVTISHYFKVSEGRSQLTVTIFLLGYALGQLLYGPFANRFGRLNTLYGGLLIAMVGTLFSILASPTEDFGLLVFGRFIEAIGCSAGLVVSAIIINDYYPQKTVHKQFSVVIIGTAIVPGIAVFIGGFLTQRFHWQACFYFILGYNLLLFMAVPGLPETLQGRNKESLSPSTLFRHYKRLLANRELLIFGSIFGLSVSFVYVFASEGPFIAINTLHMSSATYGVVALIPSIGLFAGGLLLRLFTETISRQQALLWGVLTEAAGALLLFFLFLLGYISVYALIISVFITYAGHGLVSSVGMSLAIANVHDKAMGASVASFFSLAIPVVVTYCTTLPGNKSLMLLPVNYLVLMGLIALLMWLKACYK